MNRSATPSVIRPTTFNRENQIVATENNSNVRIIEIRRFYTRQMREDSAQNQMVDITRSVSGAWKLELQPVNEAGHWFIEIEGGHYPSDVSFTFKLTGPTNADELGWNDAISSVATKLNSIKTGTGPEGKYRIHLVDGVTWKPMKATDVMTQRAQRAEGTYVEYADVTMPGSDAKDYFTGLFGIDSQINMVLRKMRRAIENDFEYRDHAILQGEPGCGKSETLKKAARMFSEDAVLWLDGTAMTSAGIIDILKDIAVMPRFIFVEEIDKADNAAVSVLLGLMDKRGEIRKTVFKSNVQRECRVCVFATANSMEKVERMQEGALLSRFGNPVTYSRPEFPEGFRRILNRELDTYELQMCCKATDETPHCGKCKYCQRRGKWIDATLDWCKEHQAEMKTDTMDPRFVIQMCIEGQDDLITGEFQRDLEKTSPKQPEYREFGKS